MNQTQALNQLGEELAENTEEGDLTPDEQDLGGEVGVVKMVPVEETED